MTPEFGYYTALICVSTGMMVFLRLAECRKPCFAYTAKKNDVCPLLHRDGD